MQPSSRRLVTVGIVAAAAVATAVVLWLPRALPGETPAALIRRLPAQNATILSLDVNTLRQGGLLQLLKDTKAGEEPEYRAFIQSSGFDYQRDLDSVLLAFTPEGSFLLAKGRFDWKKLEAYAVANRGSCYDKLCRLQGSTPERRISFLPLSSDLLALAVSNDDLAAARLRTVGPAFNGELPPQPVWLTVPGQTLAKNGSLPTGIRVFASALTAAEQLTLTMGAHGPADFEIRMEALCRTSEDARVLTAQLGKLAALLHDLAGKKSAGDLPGLLSRLSFSQADRKVQGSVQIPKSALETLLGGI